MSAGPELVIVSGLSGAGRTTAIKAMEDVGFYCVDNLPVVLLEGFVDLFGERSSRLAVVIDVREGEFLESFPAICDRLRAQGVLSELLFLEASDEVLAKRFVETRRVHPAGRNLGLLEGIAAEREILRPIARRADLVLDSTQMSVHDLKRYVTQHYTGADRSGRMELELVSFGFRHGVPDVADLMIDVRFLPNPNFEPELAKKTGLASDVADYVLESPQTVAFMERFLDFVDFLIPLYREEGKAYLTIAVGCTGGQHRSVAIVEALQRHLGRLEVRVRVTHRDVDIARRD